MEIKDLVGIFGLGIGLFASIIYEYPKPKEVQFPDTISSNLPAELRNHVLKWHVLIMSPKGFVEFLDKIDKIKMMH